MSSVQVSKTYRVDGKQRRVPVEGRNIIVMFDNIPNNSEREDTIELLKIAVCGTLHIALHKCVVSYDPKLRTAQLLFHYSRPKHAEKAARRVGMMVQFFSKAVVVQESTPADPTKATLA